MKITRVLCWVRDCDGAVALLGLWLCWGRGCDGAVVAMGPWPCWGRDFSGVVAVMQLWLSDPVVYNFLETLFKIF